MLLYHGTRRQCIVCLSSLVVLAKGNFLQWGQLFSREILWWVGNFPGGGQLFSGAIFRGAMIQGKIVRGAITQGGNFPRGQSSRHLLVRGVLQHGTKNIEREYLYISTIWKDQNSWKLLRRRLSFVSLSSFCRNNAFI